MRCRGHSPGRFVPSPWAVARRSLPTLIVVLLIACSRSPSTAERFCGEIDTNRSALFAPVVATPADAAEVVDLYRSVAEVAPLAIEPEWNQLVVNYETASTVVPGDDASLQRAVRVALESETAAVEVTAWIRDNCGIDIGPVATLVPRD